ncbi:hypothetical protein [Clostridium tertium]|uniref:hypothetical protein n=1 Tax=Clostridium tertium TaxID=1559 RepID=UPI0023B26C21|nr:hypothetical protein [Clostridium tertium]
MLTNKLLDIKICDIEKECSNTQTYREYITESENKFEMARENLDAMSDEELSKYLEFLDYLWDK